MDNKWKEFALGQVLSGYSDKVDPVILFDWIGETANEDRPKLFEDYDVVVWGPFATWTEEAVANHLYELAEDAQRTADAPHRG